MPQPIVKSNGSFFFYILKRVFNTKLKCIVKVKVSSLWHLYWVWSDVSSVGLVTILTVM